MKKQIDVYVMPPFQMVGCDVNMILELQDHLARFGTTRAIMEKAKQKKTKEKTKK